ncbi:MAG: mitochondrial 37S ribosomal protein rsm10 [Caeruleum heppii]|nr:MAG: mitochondrial 37S ribosomal protein rsm10 [Caeruleum heppii]
MSSVSYIRSPWSIAKRFKVQCSQQPFRASISTSRPRLVEDLAAPQELPPKTLQSDDSQSRATYETPKEAAVEARMPRNVQALYLKPLKRKAQYGVPSCDLQLRSYSVRNLEFFADFALRAAYYLNLPASGPVSLPRITERWTVPRSNFVNKKSQENFERITMRRLIQIQDGHPDGVEAWLAFLRKHQYYGVGMKANVWGYEQLGVGKTMDVSLENVKDALEPKWAHFGRKKNLETSEKVMEMLGSAQFNKEIDQTAASTR